jgi:hypothetical protein
MAAKLHEAFARFKKVWELSQLEADVTYIWNQMAKRDIPVNVRTQVLKFMIDCSKHEK